MEITILSHVVIYIAILLFFVSTSFRFVHKSLSMPWFATALRLIFLGVDVLHVCWRIIRATMQGGLLGWQS